MAGTLSRINLLKKKAGEAIKAEDYAKALPMIKDILNMDMDDPEGLYMAGVIFRNQGYTGIAAQLLRRNAAINPNKINSWLQFGAALHDLHAYEAAIEAYKMAKSRWPDEPNVYANLAAAYVQKGEFADSLNYAHEALKRYPDSKIAKIAQAISYLGLGRWREGFDLYRNLYGVKVEIREYKKDGEIIPVWTGQEGQTVIVQGDQGLGDEIMYASIIPDMAKDVNVIYDCHPKLVNVFRRSFPQISVYGSRKQDRVAFEEAKIDASYHISGIGRWYRGKDKEFPRVPYLIPDPEKRRKWRALLELHPKPWVGLAWQGGSVHTMREFRSLDPEDWKPVMEQGGTFVDLSYHYSKYDLEGTDIVHFDVDENDYDDTLALLAELDAVVSVTTTVVHACGAIGKKAFVLVPNMPAWRYGWKRDDMVWYTPDSVSLFRQQKDEPEMFEAVQRVAEAYGEWLDSQGFHRIRSERSGSVPQLQSVDYREQLQAGIDNAVVPSSVEGVHGNPH